MPVIWPVALRMGAPLSATESSEPSLRSSVVWLLQALHLGDGIFDGQAGGLVDDVEDLVERAVLGLGLGPSGEFLGDRVHHLDAAFGVACDDSIADGGKRGAQMLLGEEELFGAAALEVDRAAEGCVGGLQATSGEEADEEADGQGKQDEEDEEMAGLLAPLGDAVGPALLGLLDDIVHERAHGVHADPAGDVEVVVVLLADGGDAGDHRFSEGLMPAPVLIEELVEALCLIGPGDGLQLGDVPLHGCFCVALGLKEAGIVGDLVSAQSGLLVDDQFLDADCQGDGTVGFLDEADGGVGPADLPDEDAGQHEAGDDGQKQDLPEGSFESFELQAFSSFFPLLRCMNLLRHFDVSIHPAGG